MVSLAAAPLPITGPAAPGLEAIDTGVSNFMAKYHIPGGAFGMVRDGKLVFVHGYGWADTNTLELVQPDSVFRLASLSKAITAAGILLLHEEGRLSLDEPAFAILDYEPPSYPGAWPDPRLESITVRQLLNHTGGWDRDAAPNPEGGHGIDPTVIPHWSSWIARDMGVPAPPDPAIVVRWMMGQPLQFTPGTKFRYSNFGYTVLGRIIEKLTGQSYEAFMQRALEYAGITGMRVGGSRRADRFSDEVTYYDYSDGGLAESGFSGENGDVPETYSRSFPLMDAHGGWTASAIDLLRFVAAVDGRPVPRDMLSRESIAEMTARPPTPWKTNDIPYYGMGWDVRPDSGNWWHTGALPGTGTQMIRGGNGISWVMLFNFRAYKDDGPFFRRHGPAGLERPQVYPILAGRGSLPFHHFLCSLVAALLLPREGRNSTSGDQ